MRLNVNCESRGVRNLFFSQGQQGFWTGASESRSPVDRRPQLNFRVEKAPREQYWRGGVALLKFENGCPAHAADAT